MRRGISGCRFYGFEHFKPQVLRDIHFDSDVETTSDDDYLTPSDIIIPPSPPVSGDVSEEDVETGVPMVEVPEMVPASVSLDGEQISITIPSHDSKVAEANHFTRVAASASHHDWSSDDEEPLIQLIPLSKAFGQEAAQAKGRTTCPNIKVPPNSNANGEAEANSGHVAAKCTEENKGNKTPSQISSKMKHNLKCNPGASAKALQQQNIASTAKKHGEKNPLQTVPPCAQTNGINVDRSIKTKPKGELQKPPGRKTFGTHLSSRKLQQLNAVSGAATAKKLGKSNLKQNVLPSEKNDTSVARLTSHDVISTEHDKSKTNISLEARSPVVDPNSQANGDACKFRATESNPTDGGALKPTNDSQKMSTKETVKLKKKRKSRNERDRSPSVKTKPKEEIKKPRNSSPSVKTRPKEALKKPRNPFKVNLSCQKKTGLTRVAVASLKGLEQQAIASTLKNSGKSNATQNVLPSDKNDTSVARLTSHDVISTEHDKSETNISLEARSPFVDPNSQTKEDAFISRATELNSTDSSALKQTNDTQKMRSEETVTLKKKRKSGNEHDGSPFLKTKPKEELKKPLNGFPSVKTKPKEGLKKHRNPFKVPLSFQKKTGLTRIAVTSLKGPEQQALASTPKNPGKSNTTQNVLPSEKNDTSVARLTSHDVISTEHDKSKTNISLEARSPVVDPNSQANGDAFKFRGTGSNSTDGSALKPTNDTQKMTTTEEIVKLQKKRKSGNECDGSPSVKTKPKEGLKKPRNSSPFVKTRPKEALKKPRNPFKVHLSCQKKTGLTRIAVASLKELEQQENIPPVPHPNHNTGESGHFAATPTQGNKFGLQHNFGGKVVQQKNEALVPKKPNSTNSTQNVLLCSKDNEILVDCSDSLDAEFDIETNQQQGYTGKPSQALSLCQEKRGLPSDLNELPLPPLTPGLSSEEEERSSLLHDGDGGSHFDSPLNDSMHDCGPLRKSTTSRCVRKALIMPPPSPTTMACKSPNFLPSCDTPTMTSLPGSSSNLQASIRRSNPGRSCRTPSSAGSSRSPAAVPSDSSSDDEMELPLCRIRKKMSRAVKSRMRDVSDDEEDCWRNNEESSPSSQSNDDSDYDEPVQEKGRKKRINYAATLTHSKDNQNKDKRNETELCEDDNLGAKFVWIKKDIKEEIIQPDNAFQEQPDDLKMPIMYFNLFWDADLLAMIVNETNLNSVRKDGKSMNLSVQELKIFIGILIYMGIVSVPSYKDYWNSFSRVSQVADLLPLKRFQKIRAYLHFTDSTNPSVTDKLWKIRPLLDNIRQKCRNLPQREQHFSVDETMVPYKGKKAGQLRQFIGNKPHKHGFKFFNLAGNSGTVYDFLPYCGSNTYDNLGLTEQEQMLGVGAKAVICLSKSIQRPESSVVCFDNYFTSVPLLAYLKKTMNLAAIGTVRPNRLQKPPLISDRELKKKGKGAYDCCLSEENNVVVVKWVDNKIVHIASTFVGVGEEPLKKVSRWNKKERHSYDVPCPKAISTYNKHMGGVDKFDHLCEIYRMSSRAKRWYLPIVIFMLNLTLVNSWLMYMKDAELLGVRNTLPSKDFRLQIFASLTSSAKRGRPLNVEGAKNLVQKPVVPRPFDNERRDNTGHWPAWLPKKGRCRNCQKNTTFVQCLKCEMSLCFVPSRNCFFQFHHRSTIVRNAQKKGNVNKQDDQNSDDEDEDRNEDDPCTDEDENEDDPCSDDEDEDGTEDDPCSDDDGEESDDSDRQNSDQHSEEDDTDSDPGF